MHQGAILDTAKMHWGAILDTARMSQWAILAVQDSVSREAILGLDNIIFLDILYICTYVSMSLFNFFQFLQLYHKV